MGARTTGSSKKGGGDSLAVVPAPNNRSLKRQWSERPDGIISTVVLSILGGKVEFMDLARRAPEIDPRMSRVMDKWDTLSEHGKKEASLDLVCQEAGVDPYAFLGAVAAAAKKFADNSSVIIAALSQPEIVRKTIQQAMTDEGFKDREMLMKHAGFLPVPAGTTYINQTQLRVETNVGPDNGKVILPSFAKTIEDE